MPKNKNRCFCNGFCFIFRAALCAASDQIFDCLHSSTQTFSFELSRLTYERYCPLLLVFQYVAAPLHVEVYSPFLSLAVQPEPAHQ